MGLASPAVAGALRRLGYKEAAFAVSLAGVAANALMLAAFRQPERPLAVTVADVGRAWLRWGTGAGALAAASSLLARR